MPAEKPDDLFKELYRKLREFEEIVVRINKTNLATKTSSGMDITSAIAKRDSLQRLHGILEAVSNNANSTTSRYSTTEILNIATIDVASMRKKMDGIAKQRREMDVEIQAANWTNDLI